MKELKHYFSGHLFYKKHFSHNHRGIEGNIQRELSDGVTKHTYANGRSHNCIINNKESHIFINNVFDDPAGKK